MKKIINGKLYNTETATYIGNDSFENPSNFHYYDEDLYQKKNGEFFLAGEGGPLSKYGVATGIHGWCSGHAITPLSTEEAKQWVEEHCGTNTYIELFGVPEE